MFVEGDCCAVTERGFVSDVSPSLRRSTLFSGPSTVGGDETSCWVFTGREVSSFFEREFFGDSSVHPPVRIENPSKKAAVRDRSKDRPGLPSSVERGVFSMERAFGSSLSRAGCLHGITLIREDFL